MFTPIVQRHTICALATPSGISGLAVIRVSGIHTFSLVDSLFKGTKNIAEAPSHTILYGWWQQGDVRIDSITVSVYRAPHSYTGEDVVEIGCHGSPFIIQEILRTLMEAGATAALAGEFTQRAFINGKLDLPQAEAVADIIHAQSSLGAATAVRQLAGEYTKELGLLIDGLLTTAGLLELELDFSEEDVAFVDRTELTKQLKLSLEQTTKLGNSAYSSSIFRSGVYASFVGFPNAGKSSLFNAILGKERAIVSNIPGTTRDYVEDSILVAGCVVHLADTAGLHASDDVIEVQGMALTASVLKQSNVVFVVNDVSRGEDNSQPLMLEIKEHYPETIIHVVQNKSDLLTHTHAETGIYTSALIGSGIDNVIGCLERFIAQSADNVTNSLVNERQRLLLIQTKHHLEEALARVADGSSPEFIALDIRSAVRTINEILGTTWNPDILDNVFSRFCIGK